MNKRSTNKTLASKKLSAKDQKTIAPNVIQETNVPADEIVIESENSHHSFTIVAIGASAGGLEAVTQLLKNLSPTTGMAFIYVQHLSPDHKSLLPELLANTTSMAVQDIDDMEKMKPNNVYIMPYNLDIEVVDGHIKLIPRSTNKTRNLSIDVLFTSLAETHKENVVGIVLSGSASDGSKGLREIKMAGGMTFAQDDSAKFSSMPNSAIGEGIVDYVLSPKEMAEKLNWMSEHLLHAQEKVLNAPEDGIQNTDPSLISILQLIQRKLNIDFSQYKMNTVKRRMLRRMLLHKITSLSDYQKLLMNHVDELDFLYQDLLIHVTEFFRDIEAYRLLKKTVLPQLIASKKLGETLRVWVAACATGEEVYSIAILLTELQQTNEGNFVPFQIFASDLSAKAIAQARIGEYDITQLKNVSAKRLLQFFTKSKNKYRISKSLRDCCIFAEHNVLLDPAFSRIDFVSCRNLLIYLDATAQKKVISTFNYALNDGGCLMLGKSETIGSSALKFDILNKKHRLYILKKNLHSERIISNTSKPLQNEIQERKQPVNTFIKEVSSPMNVNMSQAFDAYLLANYMPASVVIQKDLEIIEFRGATEKYLRHSAGKASFNILKMASSEIVFELRNAIHHVLKTGQVILKTGIEMYDNKVEKKMCMIDIEVSPFKIEGDQQLLIIVFTDQMTFSADELDSDYPEEDTSATLSVAEQKMKTAMKAKERRIKKLEEELTAARADMGSITNDQEAANDELQSANEEIVSSNEELQSLNEELETSKEEIESTNEELTTSNQELQARIYQVEELYTYYETILSTFHEPMLILDKDVRVKSANKAFCNTFHIVEDEIIGVSLYKLGNNEWNLPHLRELLNDIVLKNHRFQDYEIELNFPVMGHKILLLNAHRILQQSKNEELIVLTIIDATEIRRLANEVQLKEKKMLEAQLEVEKKHLESERKAQASLEKANERFRQLVKGLPAAVFSCDLKGHINFYNDAAKEIWGRAPTKEDRWCGSFKLFTLDGELILPHNSSMAVALRETRTVYGESAIIERPDGTRSNTIFYAQPEFDLSGQLIGAINMGFDVTEQMAATNKIKESENRYHNLIYSSSSLIAILHGEEMIVRLANDTFLHHLGKGPEIIGMPYLTSNPEFELQGVGDMLREVYKTGLPHQTFETPISLVRNGEEKLAYYNFLFQPQLKMNGKIEGIAIFATEVTSEVILKIALIEAKEQAERATIVAEDTVKAKQQFLANMSHEIRTPMNAIVGFSNVMLKTQLTEKQKNYIQAIKTSSDSLVIIINDILDLAKVDAGKMTFEKIPFNLSTSISAMLQLFEVKANEKNVSMVKILDTAIPKVIVGDPLRLRQIILNLIGNALKFTMVGSVQLEVKLLHEDDEMVSIHFSVMDTGIGISVERMDAVFDDFGQATYENSRLFGGTGLGLGIVKKMVELQGGRVYATSELGKGSTFNFDLKFYKSKNYLIEGSNDNKTVEPITPLKKVHVLVAEDMALNQLLIKLILADFGYTFEIADNGKIAIEMLQRNKYDIVLMDLQMPEMNGFEATFYIRHTMHATIPIIALTADVTSTDVKRCIDSGMNDYISKPIDEKLLQQKMKQVLNRS